MSFGRPPAALEFVLEGGLSSGPAGVDLERAGAGDRAGVAAEDVGAGAGIGRLDDLNSFGSPCNDSTFMEGSARGDSTGTPRPKWRASTEPRSSMGVKMLRDLDEWLPSPLCEAGA